MISLIDYLILSAMVFCISLLGMVIHRNNLIVLLMCIELMLLAVNTNFLAFAQYFHQVAGEIFVLFILTVAAAESAIGLAILVLLYRKKGHIDMASMHQLEG